jgi:hypothetical protein
MTRVSKHKLKPDTQKRLFLQFVKVFESAGKKELPALFRALFTESEKIMFIKRLAVILLLSRNRSTYAIAKLLYVSDTTVSLLRVKYESGHYDSLIAVTKRRSFDTKQFWKTIEMILQAGMPPRGKGRWKWLYENN